MEIDPMVNNLGSVCHRSIHQQRQTNRRIFCYRGSILKKTCTYFYNMPSNNKIWIQMSQLLPLHRTHSQIPDNRQCMRAGQEIKEGDLHGWSQQMKECAFEATTVGMLPSAGLQCGIGGECWGEEGSDAEGHLFQQTLSCLQSKRMYTANQYFECFSEIQMGEENDSYPFHPSYENKFSSFQNFRQLPKYDDESCFPLEKVSSELPATDHHSILDPTNTEEHPSIGEQLPSQIQFDQEEIELYKKVYQGTKDDTMDLCINFKTLLMSYFRQFELVNELLPCEIAHVNQFASRSPSLKSLAVFYENKVGNEGIRQKCLKLFSGSECMERIMRSRCQMATKLQMVKFIEKMRINLFGEGRITRWKDVIKRQH